MAHNVKFLADGFCAVVWGYIGDLDYFTQFFGFPDTQGAEPCGLCPCTNQEGDVPWSDFRSSPHPAVWMTRVFKHADFIARGRFTPLLQLPGVTCFTMMIDWCQVPWYRSVFFGICTRTHDDAPDVRNSFFVHRCTVYYVSPYSTVY